jgi:hypothetical protein
MTYKQGNQHYCCGAVWRACEAAEENARGVVSVKMFVKERCALFFSSQAAACEVPRG